MNVFRQSSPGGALREGYPASLPRLPGKSLVEAIAYATIRRETTTRESTTGVCVSVYVCVLCHGICWECFMILLMLIL